MERREGACDGLMLVLAGALALIAWTGIAAHVPHPRLDEHEGACVAGDGSCHAVAMAGADPIEIALSTVAQVRSVRWTHHHHPSMSASGRRPGVDRPAPGVLVTPRSVPARERCAAASRVLQNSVPPPLRL